MGAPLLEVHAAVDVDLGAGDVVPLGRFGKPEEVAAITRFLVTEGGYVTGAQININGGMYMQ